jgi:hypothetical protein
MNQNSISILPGSPCSPRSNLLFDLQVELLFQLLFEGTGKQSTLDSQTGQSARGQAGEKSNNKLIHLSIFSLEF